MDYQKQMLALHLRANPREVLVGWYATSTDLNTFSALIQNFYSQQGDGTWPHPAVHLTVSTVPGQEIESRTYISAPIGVTAERAADSCLFIPVPHEIKYGEAEKSGLELISSAKDREDKSQEILTDLDSLERAIIHVLDLLERVSNYVNNVLDEEAEPSSALGQFLMNALSLAPKVDPADIERDLYVVAKFFFHRLMLTNSATHISKTFSSSPTSPTRFARKSTSPTASRLQLSHSVAATLSQRTARKTAVTTGAKVATDGAGVKVGANRGNRRHEHEL